MVELFLARGLIFGKQVLKQRAMMLILPIGKQQSESKYCDDEKSKDTGSDTCLRAKFCIFVVAVCFFGVPVCVP